MNCKQSQFIQRLSCIFFLVERNVCEQNEDAVPNSRLQQVPKGIILCARNQHTKPRGVSLNFTVEFEVGKDVKWVKFNVRQRGFYRVSYDAAGWAGLISLLRNNHTALSSADRANLLDDIFTLVK